MIKTKKTDTEVKHAIIKVEVQKCYDELQYYNAKLDELREKCDHPESELCTYSPRPGQYFEDTKICSICGGVISWAHNPQTPIWNATGRIDEDTPKVEWPAGYYAPKDNSDKPKIGENIVDDFKPGTTESWDDGGCATGLGGDQYD